MYHEDEAVYQPQLLGTKELIDAYWPQVQPLIEQYLYRTDNDEFDANDVYQKLVASHAFCFVFVNIYDNSVRLVLVLEPAIYPKLSAMNVVVLVGEDLLFLSDRFWKPLKMWCYMNGIRAIEALASPAIERLTRRLGFKKQAVFIRAELGECDG